MRHPSLLLCFALAACGGPPRAVHERPEYDIVAAREGGQKQAFEWSDWSAESFARAKAEGRYILVDGAAEWCHWCHVMDETTYRDPEVGRLLSERFVAIRVDIDERPDIGERYAAWGWPATIILSPDAEEIGKYQGYLEPAELREILSKVEQLSVEEATDPAGAQAAPVEALPWIGARAAMDLDAYYDPDLGGWGRRQKLPIGDNLVFELRRGAHGDAQASARAVFTLRQQRALVDPVWGGVYQYSVHGVWDEPHFEKLMSIQAGAIEAGALAFQVTGQADLLADARKNAGYITEFLRNEAGAFLVSQDADLNAHVRDASFVDGHDYYALGDAERRKLGLPRIDDHVFAYHNGLAITALVALHEAGGGARWLEVAERAAATVRDTCVKPGGRVVRQTKHGKKVRHLADHVALGRAFVALARATGRPEWRAEAERVARAIFDDLLDPQTSAFFANTVDPSAAGVFSRRERPFENNALAARFLGELSALTGDPVWREAGARALAAVASPAGLAEQGRMLGGFLLAVDALGVFRWS